MQNFFQKNIKNNDGLLNKIEAACEGLVYMSETDAPMLAFAGGPAGDVTAEIILRQSGGEPDAQIEEVDFRTFFAKSTKIQPWHSDAEKARAKKFLDLQTLLEENLRERKVFRIGKIRLDIYVVGIDTEGDLMGVTTKAVET